MAHHRKKLCHIGAFGVHNPRHTSPPIGHNLLWSVVVKRLTLSRKVRHNRAIDSPTGAHTMHDTPIGPLDVFFAIVFGAALGLLLAAFI